MIYQSELDDLKRKLEEILDGMALTDSKLIVSTCHCGLTFSKMEDFEEHQMCVKPDHGRMAITE